MRYHSVRDVLKNKFFKLIQIHTNKNVATDMMTKTVTKEKHLYCRDGVGMEGVSHTG